MAAYLARRLLQGAATLGVVALVTFLLMHAVPGGPFDARAADRAASPRLIGAQEAYYGLDDPLLRQFARYVGHLARGDLGVSFAAQGRPVSALLRERARTSLILGAVAFALVVAVGIPLGVLGAVRRRSLWDHAALAFATVGGALPGFVLSFLLLLVFADWFGWFHVQPAPGFGTRPGTLRDAVLPAVALAAPAAALVARLTRGAVLEVLGAEYMRTARAKGLGGVPLYLRHALRNAMLPVLTLLGPVLAGLVTGSIVIESIFNLPGIGTAFVTAIGQRDFGVIMGTTLLYAALIVLANLLVDLATPLLDPRVRSWR